MRVVFIGDGFHGEGNDSHLRALAESVDLTIYGCGEEPPEFSAFRELRPVRLRPGVGPRFWFYKHLDRALDADRPDVVHVLTEPWQLLALQTSRWARRSPGTAFVMHNSDRNWWTVPAGRRAARRVVARQTFARADGFVSESSGGVREAQQFGLTNGTVTAAVIMNPRDPDGFRPPLDDAARAAARARLGLPREGTGVGYLGRLSEEKGPILFVDAFQQAAARAERPIWAGVAGTGPLEQEVAGRAAGTSITCLGALDYPNQVASFLHAVDMLVMPSVRVGQWEEQAPRAVVEAMLSGCIVVGTPVGGIPEMLDGTGIVVDESTPAALADGILRAATDPAGSQLRRDARTRAIDVYSGRSAATSLVDIWERALLARRKHS
jgi:glycosyltransferase involved in cell wall biosynthesis